MKQTTSAAVGGVKAAMGGATAAVVFITITTVWKVHGKIKSIEDDLVGCVCWPLR